MQYRGIINELLKKKFVKDVSWTLIATFIKSLSGILINILVGNFYQAEGLGIFGQVLAIYLILSIISTFGINNSVLKYTAECKEDPHTLRQLVTSALVLSVLLATTLIGLFHMIISLYPALITTSTIMPPLRNTLIALPFFSANKVLMGFLNGMRRMRLYSSVRSMRWLLIISFILYSYYTKKTLAFTLYAFPATEILLFLWLAIYLKTKRILPASRPPVSANPANREVRKNLWKTWIKKHLIFGGKTALTGSISELNNKIDILLIGFFMSNHDVGIYNLASSIARGFIMAASVVTLNFNPVISTLWAQKNTQLLKEYIAKLKKGSRIVMIPLLVMAGLMYPLFVTLFMKSNAYMASVPIFYILLPGIAIVSLFHWSGGLLSMAGYPGQSIKISSSALLFNIAANIILIPEIGIKGAALATGLSYFLVIFLQRFFIKKKLALKIF
ncbi:MAG: flippase [bacterium]|nr:flippase [bacterium]